MLIVLKLLHYLLLKWKLSKKGSSQCNLKVIKSYPKPDHTGKKQIIMEETILLSNFIDLICIVIVAFRDHKVLPESIDPEHALIYSL